MTLPLLSKRAVREIRRQQARVWDASRAISNPTVNLILERPGGGQIGPQEVVVVWDKGGGNVVALGDDTPRKDLTFRRLVSDGFDVRTGDKFMLGEHRGVVTRVFENKGIIRAEARITTGVTWP